MEIYTPILYFNALDILTTPTIINTYVMEDQSVIDMGYITIPATLGKEEEEMGMIEEMRM